MTIFERAEAQSVNDMAGEKRKKKRRRPNEKVWINRGKWDAPSTYGTTKIETGKTIRKVGTARDYGDLTVFCLEATERYIASPQTSS